MPFDNSCQTIRLIGEQHLFADCKNLDGDTVPSTLDLNNLLGNANGKFKWGIDDFSSSARNIALNGSILRAELKARGDKWVADKVDLSEHIRNNNGKLEFFDDSAPPPYPESTLRSFRSEKSSSESRSASFFMHAVATDKLRLKDAILHAECLRADGSYTPSQLNLNDYIGVVNGKLVWGRTNFIAACERVKLEGYTLVVECRDQDGKLVKSTLDLTRYLHAYDGGLGVKVAQSDAELSSLFSQARWMKVKVVTEPDASVVINSPAFKAAFNLLATATSKHVTASMTEEVVESVTRDVMASMTDKVKASTTRIVKTSMTKELTNSMNQKIEEAFTTAKKAVFESCNQMIAAAVDKVTIQCNDEIVGAVKGVVESQCKVAVSKAVEEVATSAIEHFQERVEILMEREMVSADLRSAYTKAAYFELTA